MLLGCASPYPRPLSRWQPAIRLRFLLVPVSVQSEARDGHESTFSDSKKAGDVLNSLLFNTMECLAARFDRGFSSVFLRFGSRTQYCRRYYTAARTRGGLPLKNSSRKTPEFRHCPACSSNAFRPITDSRTFIPSHRSFTTSWALLADLNKGLKTEIAGVQSKSTQDGVEVEDFFGMEGGPGVVDVGEGERPVAEAMKKYDYLFEHRQTEEEEKVYVTTFGSLRYDRDNLPWTKKSGMADRQQTDFSSSPIDDKYFSLTDSEIGHRNAARDDDRPPSYVSTSPGIRRLVRDLSRGLPTEHSSNFIEEQYFHSRESDAKRATDEKTKPKSTASGFPTAPENYIEEQCFGLETSAEESPGTGLSGEVIGSRQAERTSSFIEEQYFNPDYLGPVPPKRFSNSTEEEGIHSGDGKTESKDAASGFPDLPENSSRIQEKYVEEQRFQSYESAIEHSQSGKATSESAASGFSDVPGNVVEEQYFGREASGSGRPEIVQSSVEKGSADSKMKRRKAFVSKVDSNGNASVDMDFVNELLSSRIKEPIMEHQVGVDAMTGAAVEFSRDGGRGVETKRSDRKLDSHESVEETEEVVEHTGLRKSNAKEWIKPDIENPKTAFDFAMKLRHERKIGKSSASTASPEDVPVEGHGGPDEKVDSLGFRLYSDQVLDLDKEPEFVVLNILRNSALYNENDILALSKPYGLPVHDGSGHRHFLTKYLPELAKEFCQGYQSRELYTVHRLDKETTGVLLLAKTQKMADRLNDMFAKGEVKKTYWALTKGSPSPLEGIIDIPIGEITMAGKQRMVLKPVYSEELSVVMKKSWSRAKKAVTHYKVLSSYNNAALVELSPSTGVKHQLRVHLASALACPVLGDHKYSHFTRLAPQKLSSDVLQRLNMRQSKVRTLPMHLHARGVVLPEMMDGKNIIIGARLPKHFTQNMKRLKLRYEK